MFIYKIGYCLLINNLMPLTSCSYRSSSDFHFRDRIVMVFIQELYSFSLMKTYLSGKNMEYAVQMVLQQPTSYSSSIHMASSQ